MQLTPHFNLNEGFESSDGAPTTPEILKNIQYVANELEKIRVKFGKPIKVNCCYRSPGKNSSIAGASKTSAHMLGLAVDIDGPTDADNDELGELIHRMAMAGEIELDQEIFEHYTPENESFKWIHYSPRKNMETPPRKMFLVCDTIGGEDKYLPLTPELAKRMHIAI